MENAVKEYLRIKKKCDKLFELQNKLRLKIFTCPETINKYKKALNEYLDAVEISIEIREKYSKNEEFQKLLKLTRY